MTEGTSQGLFIVVAIVIFGIFVSLSYTLFGKTLQPQMVQLFEQSIEQATNKDVVFKRGNIEVRIKSNDYLEVFVKNKDLPEDTRVLFPTWTTHASGLPGNFGDPTQDDLQKNWVTSDSALGTYIGNNTWKYTVKRSEHFDEYGVYIIDTYKNGSGSGNHLGGIRFNWEKR